MKPTIILHIGLERTGTTSLQKFCVDRTRELRRASILYPTRSLAFARINHVPLASCYFSDRIQDFTVVAPPAAKPAVLASLFREIDTSGVAVVLLSAEHLSSRLRGPQVHELASDFAGYDCRIAVVVRDHMARFFSSYSNYVVGGGVASLEAVADATLAPKSLHFRYAETIRLWEEAFGKENVQAFSYDRRGDILRSMLERFATKKFDAPRLSSYRENQSYGPIVTEAFRTANSSVMARKSWSNTMGKWERRAVARVLMRRWISMSSIDASAGQWSLDGKRLARFQAIAAGDRKWLSERYGVRLVEEERRSTTAAAPTEFWVRTFLKRADALWLLLGAIQPILSLAPLIGGMSRLLRDKVRL